MADLIVSLDNGFAFSAAVTDGLAHASRVVGKGKQSITLVEIT
jgi:hypothetical protein